jgi:benzoate-CoA ligase family protein
MNAATDFIDARIAAGQGERTAIVETDTGRERTYTDVWHDVNRMGRALARLGVRPEERVMILLPDCAAFVTAFFGAIKIGAVAVPVSTLLTQEDYRYLLADSRARVLIVYARFVERIEAVREGLPFLHHVIVVGDGPPAYPRLDDLLAGEDGTLEPLDMHEDDTAFWLYSSGTTGFPKGVIHLQHAMRVCAESFGLGVMGMTSADRALSVAKLSFAYGLGNALYMPFFVGATTLLCPDKPDPERIFEIVARYGPTVFFAVPTSYGAMLAAIDSRAQPPDFSSVRLCSSAGEPLAASLYERWRAATGVEVLDGIGSTEALHTYVANRAGRVRPGSTGELILGYDARIVDADDRDVPDGTIGQLLVKGRSLCAGYWNKQAQTRRAIVGEWLRSGDLFSRDADGYFWYQGRSDDMLKCGGFWVSPTEVEAALLTHPSVLESAVIGREDETRLVKPMAFVVLKAGYAAIADLGETLKTHVRERLAVYKYPRWIEFVDELPRTATGKLQRFKLRAETRETIRVDEHG